MNWMKVGALFAFASGLIAYALWLIMTIGQVSSGGFSAYSVIAMVLAVIGLGWSSNGFINTLKELTGILTKYLPSPRDDDRQ